MTMRRSILVTGASKGLGRAIALAYASHGYDLVIHGRDQKRLEKVRAEVNAHNVKCKVVVGDITEDTTIKGLTDAANEMDLNILINNAGIYLKKPVGEMSITEFRRVLDVNLIAPVVLTKQIFNVFKRNSSGLVININSIAGKNPGMLETAYCASKHGLKGFMGAFQFESLQHNIPIINIYLGAMNTDMTAGRGDFQKYIKTEEVANIIYNMHQNYSSLRVTEIEILRKIY